VLFQYLALSIFVYFIDDLLVWGD